MKAIVYTAYGAAHHLQLKEIAKPTPRNNEVLVKVRAASINSWDWDMVRGKPLVVRMWGIFKPRYTTPGCDIAGIVESVGKDVTIFKPGDEVYGDMCQSGFGAFAEYKCARENTLTLKSSKMSFEEAAAIPQAATMAVQALRDVGKLKAGQKVLINGAGGAVGTFAVQLAKEYGAVVTGVDHPAKFDMMRSIGFDHLVDYTKEDFTKNKECYDLILDVRTDRRMKAYTRVLNQNGMYTTVGGSLGLILRAMMTGWWIKWRQKKYYRMVAMKANTELAYINERFEAGKIRPVIDSVWPLHQTAGAFELFSSGRQKGKIVISVQ